MIKGVIFDVDGTLLDSMPVWERLGELYLKSLEVEAEAGLRDVLYHLSMEEGAAYLISHYSLPLTLPQVMEGLHACMVDAYANRVPLKEGVRGFLDGFAARRIPVNIATSGDGESVEAALHRLGVRKYFDRIFTCSDGLRGKAFPDVYLAAARHMGTEPGDTLVFEDSPYAVLTAKKAGFRVAAVYDPSGGEEQEKVREAADFYLPAYGDFDAFMKEAE